MAQPTPEQSLARATFKGSAKLRLLLIAALLACLGGCSSHSQATTKDLLIVVPGAGGYGPAYSGMVKGLQTGGIDESEGIRTFKWGSHLFVLNLQDSSIHRKAESLLAAKVAEHLRNFPDGRIDLLGHSAGCGVILGALARVDPSLHVGTVILLAPSVSPAYNLKPALEHISGSLNVFHSTRDTLWLSWRASTFGTYDNIKTRAAGNTGFSELDRLPAPLQSKIVQFPYDPTWRDLGNHGNHMGPVAGKFARSVLAPLLKKERRPLTLTLFPGARE